LQHQIKFDRPADTVLRNLLPKIKDL